MAFYNADLDTYAYGNTYKYTNGNAYQYADYNARRVPKLIRQ